MTTISVIGAGQMGAGIAVCSLIAGYKTNLFDTVEQNLAKGLEYVESQLTKALSKGTITESEAKDARAKLTRCSSLSELSDSDMVIEAIIENYDIKAQLFKSLSPLLKESAVIASNTSSISITRLAANTKKPNQVIGMHFMNPVPIMKLVEIIRGLQTDDKTYTATVSVAEKMRKTTVLGVDTPGFVVNRILCPMINEAIFLLQEGVKAQDIDTAMKLGTNQPMGPLELADFVGLDTLLSILRILHAEIGEDKYRPCPLLVKYVEAGWYGKKNGRGFYSY